MSDAPVEPDAQADFPIERPLAVPRLAQPIPGFREPISIAAHVTAAIGSFSFLILAPTILLEFVPLPDEFSEVLVQVVPLALLERSAAAFEGALVFLVIGIGCQVWQYRRKVSPWWPLLLAFPVAGILIVPDALARGQSAAGPPSR